MQSKCTASFLFLSAVLFASCSSSPNQAPSPSVETPDEKLKEDAQPAVEQSSEGINKGASQSTTHKTATLACQILIGGCGLGKLILLGEDKTIAWEMDDAREASDVWMLPSGQIVHSTKHGFQQIKPNYKTGKGAEVVWEVKAPKGSECHACQPIGNNRYLVGYSSDKRSYIAEVDNKGREYKVIEVDGQTGKHSSFRQVRKTAEGTYLTTQQRRGGKAREYNAEGKLIRTFPSGHFSALRLENGNTLLGCSDEHRLIEVDQNNNIVWELKQGDIEGVKLGFIAGIWPLKNGNILFTNWGGHGGSTGGAILEVSRDKKLVYSSGDTIKNRASSIFVSEKAAK